MVAAKKPFFRIVDPQVDFPAMEREILTRWYKEGIVSAYLARNKNSTKRFSFLDGPITANNPMGVHHAWGRTYKDVFQRYKNMLGFAQRFQNGFDAQGLWVEVEVEKELGLKSKRDIENLVSGDKKASIAKFVELCKERVRRFAKIQTEQSKRLGYFMDWDNSYYTLSDENNYMIWHFLKRCSDRGLIYKGHDSVPWCPRCGTAISQHEMLTENYKEVTHDSVYIKYPLSGRENSFLLVWTTTPWTLPANVAIAVDTEEEYVLATEKSGASYYLLPVVAGQLGLKVIEKVSGSKLVDLEYLSPFDALSRVGNAMSGFQHKVVATDSLILPILAEEGTGLVHVATGAGTEDFALGKKLRLPIIDVIDEGANYLEGLGEFTGKNAKNHPEIILDFLENRDAGKFLFKVEKITHRYPACWRCKTELVWRVVDEWYIKMDPLREPMKKIAKKINWIPDFGLERELDWLSNMHDWLISKKRYWGLALPIWECKKCGHFEVVGGYEELEKKAQSGWEKFKGHTPHRPWIDEITMKCSKCGSVAERIPDVGNPWLDAGIVPFSTMPKEWFPADFITESFPGQFKNWFYSLIAMSAVLEDKEPFKTVLGFATLLAENGQPMHKSSGNAIEFNEAADKIGVDVMRFMYVKQDPAQNLLFGYHLADQVRRSFYLMLWNIYNFFVTYANLDGWRPRKMENGKARTPLRGGAKMENVLDIWIMARLKQATNQVTDSLNNYDARIATASIEEFVQDLSLWYVRRSRNRVGPNVENGEDKTACYGVLHHVLVALSQLLAPIAPFISEEMYTNLTGEKSVHLSDWPTLDGIKEDEKELVSEMKVARMVVEKGHAARKLSTIPVRQPLAKVTVAHSIKQSLSSNKALDNDVLQLIEEELNVKEVVWKEEGIVEPEVDLDTEITPELEEEGKTRELARQIQEERKRLGTALSSSISVSSPWIPRHEKNLEWLKKRTLAKELKKGEALLVKEVKR